MLDGATGLNPDPVQNRETIARLERTRFAGVRWVTQASSTNDEVAALARGGAAEGAAVAADWQSAGRGRRGRSWMAPPGSSLLVSVLLRPPASSAHLLLMAAGLAAVEACSQAAGVEASLKWPNDVVVPAGKLGGILAEVCAGALVVGLGVNVDWGSSDPDRPVAQLPDGAVSLAGVAGRPVDRIDVLVGYLTALDRRCDQDPTGLVADWTAACSTIGRAVRVELPGGATVEGVATGVTEDGRLVIGDTTVSAGDVVHVRSCS